MSERVVELIAVQFPVTILVLLAIQRAVRSSHTRLLTFFQREKELIERFEKDLANLTASFTETVGRIDNRQREELERLRRAYDARVRTLNAEIRRLEQLLRRPGG